MKKRMIVTLAVLGGVVVLLGLTKYFQIRAAMAQGGFQMPPEAVTTIVAGSELWDDRLTAVGTAVAVQGVMVAADLPGIVERIAFESGQTVRAGQVLVHLDTRQERAQLAAAEAESELASANLARFTGLREKGVTSQAEFDQAAAESKQGDAHVGEIRAMIERKTIRAPFSGITGIRQVNLGQYLAGGAPVVQLQALDPIYVNFSVPQQRVTDMVVGAEIEVTAAGLDGVMSGRITAIDSVVDGATRNVQVQATFANPEGRLRPGMFVEAGLGLGETTEVVPIPASAVSYAPFGDSVYIVDEMEGPDGASYQGVRQQFVKLGPARGDQIAVLSGIEPGEEVVTSGVFKLRSGAAVVVNNEIQPGNDPTPEPEDS